MLVCTQPMKASRLSSGQVPVTNPLIVDGKMRRGRRLAVLLAIVTLSILMIAPLFFSHFVHVPLR